MLFKNTLGQNMKTYVDDILVESVKGELHVSDLREAFNCRRMHSVHSNHLDAHSR